MEHSMMKPWHYHHQREGKCPAPLGPRWDRTARSLYMAGVPICDRNGWRASMGGISTFLSFFGMPVRENLQWQVGSVFRGTKSVTPLQHQDVADKRTKLVGGKYVWDWLHWRVKTSHEWNALSVLRRDLQCLNAACWRNTFGIYKSDSWAFSAAYGLTWYKAVQKQSNMAECKVQ